MGISVAHAATYLAQYISAYRLEYEKMIEPPPLGAGYPSLNISPFLRTMGVSCVLADDGYVLVERSTPPRPKWWITGGPAFCVDYSQSREPDEYREARRENEQAGRPTGIYIFPLPNHVASRYWLGKLPSVVELHTSTIDGIKFHIERVECRRFELLRRLTFGWWTIVESQDGDTQSDFWRPTIVRKSGFFNAERTETRYFDYLETAPHIDEAAWDTRSICVRVMADVKRDFRYAAIKLEKSRFPTGTIMFGHGPDIPDIDRLTGMYRVIEGFASLLEGSQDTEAVFHEYIDKHPEILDLYAKARSKPRFHLPPGETQLGKSYLEPDFVLEYPDGGYKLVEIERPTKAIGTLQGHPRSELTQASFQIAEWRAYLEKHYQKIQATFPGLTASTPGLLVIGRNEHQQFGTHGIKEYKTLLRSHLQNIEILTYDDLLDRARQAYVRLTNLL